MPTNLAITINVTLSIVLILSEQCYFIAPFRKLNGASYGTIKTRLYRAWVSLLRTTI